VHADGPEVVFFGGVSLHLTWLQVNIAIELDGQATLEAVKVNDPLLEDPEGFVRRIEAVPDHAAPQ
jgi:hypothetical protein